MKRFLSFVGMLLLAVTVSAQSSDFSKGWYLQLQGGASHTVGETDFLNLVSPAASMSVGYQFAPALSARINATGFQGKGALVQIGGEDV